MKHIFLALIFILSQNAIAAHYNLDKGHSDIGFKVKHLMITKVPGKFEDFTGSFDYDEKTNKVENVNVTIQVSSINTSDKKRDDHLKSPDFFDAEKHPTVIFKSTKPTSVKINKATKLPGNLTIRGVTKPVVLDVTYTGTAQDPWGNTKVGFEAKTKINRKDFGVSWNKPLDKGGVVVSDDVEITILGEANKEVAKK